MRSWCHKQAEGVYSSFLGSLGGESTLSPKRVTTQGYTHVIGDDHRKVAEQLGEFFAQVRLNLPKYKNGSGDPDSQAAV
jgi:hypothetical protein